MSILTSPLTAVKSTPRTSRTADEILLWVIANRQEAKASPENRVGVSITAWGRMTPPDRRAVGRRLVALGCPRLGGDLTAYERFASFVDACVDGVPIPAADDDQVDDSWDTWENAADAPCELGPEAEPIEPARSDIDLTSFDEMPTVEDEAPRFVPTAEMEAEHIGWELGYAGVEARAPEGWAFSNLVAFYGGWLAGRDALRDETLAYHAWLDELEADAAMADRYSPFDLAVAC